MGVRSISKDNSIEKTPTKSTKRLSSRNNGYPAGKDGLYGKGRQTEVEKAKKRKAAIIQKIDQEKEATLTKLFNRSNSKKKVIPDKTSVIDDFNGVIRYISNSNGVFCLFPSNYSPL